MSNIKDVAKLAGVSVPTVYKVFNPSYYTSSKVRKKVLDAVRELNYTHKAVQKKETQTAKKVIAIFIDEILNPFYEAMILQIVKEMERHDYVPMVMYTFNNARIERQNFELAIAHQCDGIMFVPAPNGDRRYVEHLIAKRYPLVQLFRSVFKELDTIMIDDELGTYLAAQHLIQSGHKRIMMISKTNPAIYIQREMGFTQAFKDAKLPVEDDWIYITNYVDCAKEMIKEKICRHQPTAILSTGENISINVLQALAEMKLSIPGDISLVIYDNVPWAQIYGITTVAHPYERIGQLIVELLHHQFESILQESSDSPSRLVLDPTLEARNSVKIIT